MVILKFPDFIQQTPTSSSTSPRADKKDTRAALINASQNGQVRREIPVAVQMSATA
jgi:hypothetical protein